MDKKQLIKDYKQQKQPAGIYAVHNKTENKMFIGTSKNLPAVLRRFDFTLKMGSFPYAELVEDYKKLGSENFEIKIIDELDINKETEKDINAELNSLEELWIEKLKSEGVKFYNKT